MSLNALLGAHASDSRIRDNVVTDGQFTITYRELGGLLDETSAALAAAGIVPGDCLSVVCANSVASGVLLLTLMRDGYSFVLVPPAIGNDIKPTPLFCRYMIEVGTDAAPSPASTYMTVAANPVWNGQPVPAGKFLLRTSGSMGASKIVVHAHDMLMGNAANCVLKYGFRPESRCAVPVPLAHMYGFGAEFLPAIQAGASIDIQDKTNLLIYLDREKKFRPTIAFVTPAICEMLLKGYKTPRDHYDVIVTSGQRIGEETFASFDRMVNGRLINQYGSSEMGATSACDPGDSFEERQLGIGKPMHGVELRIGEGDPGELFVRHPFGYDGYLDDTGGWIRQVEPGEWYRTGDLARADETGAIKVLGRAGTSVNRDGYLVLLEDVERIVEQLPEIAQAVVLVAPGASARGERIAAFCTLKNDEQAFDGPALRSLCFDRMPRHALPDEFRVLPAFPLLASGKVDRRSLTAELINT